MWTLVFKTVWKRKKLSEACLSEVALLFPPFAQQNKKNIWVFLRRSGPGSASILWQRRRFEAAQVELHEKWNTSRVDPPAPRQTTAPCRQLLGAHQSRRSINPYSTSKQKKGN